jgi:3-oxoacyl-[acyl-carrier protein] reductase
MQRGEPMKIDFSGKTVLITGATRGIGQRIAEDMEQCGATLILVGPDADEARQLNAEAERDGLKRRYYGANFTNRAAVETLIEDICNHHRIDVCVNNAGINKINSIDEVENNDWDDILSVNLQAPMVITRHLSDEGEALRADRQYRLHLRRDQQGEAFALQHLQIRPARADDRKRPRSRAL